MSKQEPVGWLCTESNIIYDHDTSEVDRYHGFAKTVPLYTHPTHEAVHGLVDALLDCKKRFRNRGSSTAVIDKALQAYKEANK